MAFEQKILTADEINCLIYSYFQDAGFNHSAFALRNEGRLQKSPCFEKHIRRGELIELLSKALLYLEVESHWRNDEMTSNCKSSFSLIEPHVCSPDAPAPKPAPVSATAMDVQESNVIPLHEQVLKQNQSLTPNLDGHGKRKTSPVPTDGPAEKRPRRNSVDMEIDGHSDSARSRTPPNELTPIYDNYHPPSQKPRTVTRPQGPGDLTTDAEVVLLLSGHKTEVFVCAFNPKHHNLLASGSKDAVVHLWDLPDPPTDPWSFAQAPGEPIALENVSKALQGDLTSLNWNPEGTLLAIGSYDSVLRVCTSQGSIYFSHPQHQKGPIFATRFSKNGAWLLTASLDGTTCLWDIQEKRLHKQYRCHKDCCLDVEWLNDDTFASAGADMCIFIMRVDEDESIKTLIGHKDEINMIRVNPSGTRLASCSDDGTAYIWKVDNLSNAGDAIPGLSASDQVVVLRGHNHSVSTVGWCVDHPAGTNELIATSSFDGTARLWDSVTGECLHVFRDHRRPLYALTFSPDGKFVSTGSGDGWLHIYHTRTYERLWSWFAGSDKPGVFEIDWQEHNGVNRIAMALECRQVAVLDVNKLDVFRSPEFSSGADAQSTARIEDA
ncbi:WD40 repeat-like protein [Crassisporium funariophilum]|nr:WD40 repeat-like protein [Crassisporium funariophilum]